MSKDLNKILLQSECPSESTLLNYSKGKLESAEAHAVEMHLIDCEMCADQMEGMQQFESETQFNILVNQINTEINKGIEKKDKSKIILFQNRYYKYAAVLLIFIGMGYLINKFVFYNKQQTSNVAEFIEEGSERAVMPYKSKEEGSSNKDFSEDIFNERKESDSKASETDNTESLRKENRGGVNNGCASVDQPKVEKFFDSEEPEIDEAIDLEFEMDEEISEEINTIDDVEDDKKSAVKESQGLNSISELKKDNTESPGTKNEKAAGRVVSGVTENPAPASVSDDVVLANKSAKKPKERKHARAKKSSERAESAIPAQDHKIQIPENSKILYENGDYDGVLDIYYYNQPTKQQEDIFYIGMSLFKLRKFEESLAYFDQAIINDPKRMNEAKFYKALSLKELNRKDEAKQLFQELIQQKTELEEKSSFELEKLF